MREIVYHIIYNYYQKDTNLNLSLKNIKHPDINKITLRVYGIIENKLYLEYLVAQSSDHQKLDLEIKIILMASLYEVLFLKTPQYVVISEYQKLCKKVYYKGLKYVSFYLHNKLLTTFITPHFSNEVKNLSIKYSINQALLKLLIKQYPDDYLKIITSKKLTYVRQLKSLLNPQDFIPTMFNDLYISKKNVIKTKDYQHNNIIIQDLGSYLVTKAIDPQANDIILDLCAAPGNKSLHIYKYTTHLYANEINYKRYLLMQENFQKHHTTINTLNCDGQDYQHLKQLTNNLHFNKILVDAPCSGLGDINSKPELKYKPFDTNLITIQQNLLTSAYHLVNDNGYIIYSTCSINKLENEANVKWFLDNFNVSLQTNNLLDKIIGSNNYGYTLLPYQYQQNGFFIAIFKKGK